MCKLREVVSLAAVGLSTVLVSVVIVLLLVLTMFSFSRSGQWFI